MIERTYGRDTRENAGISSESKVRILAVESLRFPGEGSSAQGKSGPKEKRLCDTGVEGNRGRGKTRPERDSEKYSNEVSRSTLARKA